MDTTKFLTGTIAGTIAGFAVGFLVFGLALEGYMADNVAMKAETDFLWLILGHVAYAALITYIFLQWAGIKTAATGAKAGAIIALLGTLAYNWIYLGTADLFTGGVVPTVVDAIAASVVWAVGGAAIGWALGRGD